MILSDASLHVRFPSSSSPRPETRWSGAVALSGGLTVCSRRHAGGSRCKRGCNRMRSPACALAGIDAGTLRRWKAGDGLIQGDRRPDADRPIPSHALSEAERAWIIEIANEPRFADTPPARIVPALADEGIYIANEFSFHRVLRAHDQMNRRGRAQPPRTSRPPRPCMRCRYARCYMATTAPP